MNRTNGWVLVGLLGLSACGQKAVPESTNDGAGDAGPIGTGPLLPMAVGNYWKYQVTDSDGVVSTKTTTVDSESEVGGSGIHKDDVALHLVTIKDDETDRSESWQAVEGDTVVRYRELSYQKSTGDLELDEDWEPSKLHVDGSPERTKQGASYLMIYTENKLEIADGGTSKSEARDRWTVVDVGEQVTVPAGTFQGAVHLQKSGSSLKEYWYVHGVGKVREVGSQTEELLEYHTASD